MAERVGDGVFPALVRHGALDRRLIAHCPLEEAARHAGVGHEPAFAHRRGELGLVGDPVFDGAQADAKESASSGLVAPDAPAAAGDAGIVAVRRDFPSMRTL
jgi:hypothetical protein